MRSRASRRRLSDNDIRCRASDRRWFPALRRSTFTEGAIMERAEYHRHSRARMAETAKDPSRRATPDAPERIDDRRRCTRLDHRTCCRGSRGSASLPCHTLRKRVEMCHAGSRRRPILNATTSPLYARRYTNPEIPHAVCRRRSSGVAVLGKIEFYQEKLTTFY
jgi:hypothetical protein